MGRITSRNPLIAARKATPFYITSRQVQYNITLDSMTTFNHYFSLIKLFKYWLLAKRAAASPLNGCRGSLGVAE